MTRRIDLTGQRFGRLLVQSPTGQMRHKCAIWQCLCDCGKTCETTSNKLRTGHTKSCGCLRMDYSKENFTIHGEKGTGTYRSWYSMLDRCTNPKCKKYPAYGGIGITVCDEWRTYTNFRRDMGVRPEGHTIDRIDNDLGYFKGNCRWATATQQRHNRRVACTSFAQAEEVRSLRSAGMKIKEIVSATGVKKHTVDDILYRNMVSKPGE